MEEELRILMLDDSPADAELEEDELRKAGLVFTSKVVDTREAFLKELDEFLPDLILSDYELPSFDALAALRIAKEKCPDVPFILVTGKLVEEFAIEKLKEGATDYVLKSNLKRLVPSVKRALEEAKMIAERKQMEKALRESEKRVRLKLDTILSPEADIGALELSDIIDCDTLQTLMNEFYLLTNIGIGIIDLHGRVLVGTGWQDICTKFHRINPETCRMCIESDLDLSRNVPVGTFKLYRCRNNMWDMATPIMFGDRHVGNIFLGQFLFDDEMLDYETFRQQARRYGFDEQEYTAALDRVPRWSRKTVNAAMSFYTAFAGMIGNLSYSNIKLAQALEERKRAEEALRESEEKYHSVIDNAADAILLIDMDGKLREVNKKAQALLGYSREELMAMQYAMIHPREELERTIDAFDEIILKGFTYFRDGIILRKDGKTVPVDITGTLIACGDKLIVQEIFRDITERRQAEQEKRNIMEQLFQAQKMESVGQLAGGIAHDFNNILTAMIGYGHMLKIKLKDDEPLSAYADHILSLSDRAANLTKSLLAFSRKQIIDPRPIDLNEIIKGIDHLLSRIIGEDIRLQTTLSEEDMIVMADPGQIEQVLLNLATNAKDAMPEGGLLTIQTETEYLDQVFIRDHGFGKEGSYALITITDTGAGMDRETREKIFEPFFTTKEVGKGTGLGLAMAYGIIKQHEGYINVYSEPCRGTTFRIYLPLIQAEGEERKPEAIQAIEKGTETVLLAEDETEVREVTKRLLEDNGYQVITAADGQAAINEFTLHKKEIQLVLLDVIMPNKSGREVYDEIKQIKPDIKVLFMSGYPADVIHKHGILQKEFVYIEKPASPTKLLRKIREVLGK